MDGITIFKYIFSQQFFPWQKKNTSILHMTNAVN